MADVFISYAREDRARAEQVARGLEGLGLDVFWDSEIPPGQTWADYIESKLSLCKAVIVLWSANSTKSQWVREEARMGRDKGVLIPAMIDNSQAPFGFGEVQAANLSTWTGDSNHPDWRRFSEAVRAACGSAATPRPQAAMGSPSQAQSGWRSSAPTQSSEPKKGGIKPLWVIGGLVAVALVVVIGFAAIGGGSGGGDVPMPDPSLTQPPQQTPVQTAEQQQVPQGDGSPQAIILAQLQQAQNALGQQGYTQVGQPVTGGLAQSETWNWPVQLNPGWDYRVIGVCDRDCSDLDLILFNDQNQTVTQDTSVDDHPILSVQTGTPGNFTIQVLMYNCSVAPCYYAIALYARQAG